MNTARMLTAAAVAALLSGSAALAQTSPNTPSTGQPADAQGATPATDDAATDANRQTPPAAPGDAATSNTGQSGAMSNQGSMSNSGSMSNEGSMSTQGSMSNSGAMNPGAMGSANAGGSMGATMGTSTNAGGAMGETMGASGSARVTAMAPIPDTPENRARYGQPESNAGKRSRGEGPVGSARRR